MFDKLQPKQVVGGVDPSGEPQAMSVDESGNIKVSSVGGNNVKSDILTDAWGRMKTIIDHSIFHGVFTFNIHPDLWLVEENGTELTSSLTSTAITSVDGALLVKSGGTSGNTGFLRSRRHPRYQPNRGHLFSTAGYIDVPNAIGIRDWGLINGENACCFKLEDGVLYAYIISGGVEKNKEVIDLTNSGLTIADLDKGTLYDIQFQWRGVGNYFFYINQKLVHTIVNLGVTTALTIENPAMPVGFRAENTNGTEVQMRFGCVDVTSEGGDDNDALYSSVSNTTSKTTNSANYPIIIVKVSETLNGMINSRDILALRSSIGADGKGFFKAYTTRDATAITGAVFTAKPGSSIEYDVVATAINTTKCSLLWNRRMMIDRNLTIDNPSDFTNFYLVGGDYLIFTAEKENPTQTLNSVVSVEMGEEI